MTTNPLHYAFALLLVAAILALAHWLNRFTWWRSADDDKLTKIALVTLTVLMASPVLHYIISTGLTE